MGNSSLEMLRLSIGVSPGRSIDVLISSNDIALAKLVWNKLGVGQVETSGHIERKGIDVRGRLVNASTIYRGKGMRLGRPTGQTFEMDSEAGAILADRIVVIIMVTAAKKPDEAIEYIGQVDLAAIEAFASKLPPVPAPPESE